MKYQVRIEAIVEVDEADAHDALHKVSDEMQLPGCVVSLSVSSFEPFVSPFAFNSNSANKSAPEETEK